ncbi:MAG: chorismate-binding protein [Hyphomicrobiales bacterium]
MHFALLDDNYSESGQSYLFDDLVEFVRCDTLAEVPDGVARIEEEQKRGLYAVGCASYELAEFYGYHTKPRPAGAPPLLYFGLFARKTTLSNGEVDEFLTRLRGGHEPFFCDVRPAIDEVSYLDGITRIKEHLIAGDTYQVNFTFENQMNIGGCDIALYQEMRRAQPVEFGALLKFPGLRVLSRSPELFFSKQGEALRARPMKGTEARDLNDPQRDEAQKEKLVSDEKQRAENCVTSAPNGQI